MEALLCFQAEGKPTKAKSTQNGAIKCTRASMKTAFCVIKKSHQTTKEKKENSQKVLLRERYDSIKLKIPFH